LAVIPLNKMTSKEFEKLISKIHSILEPDGTNVIWNDHIPDPDNPKQPRQIDITIIRQDKTIRIECRNHKEPQDVTWIEELIGRRLSLQIDEIIAVSASGFTQGAKKKADSFNIEIKELQSLKDEDIYNWKDEALCFLTFFRIKSLTIQFYFNHDSELNSDNYTEDELTEDIIKNKSFYNEILDKYFHWLLDIEHQLDILGRFTYYIDFITEKDKRLFNQKPLERIQIIGDILPFRRKIKIKDISIYKDSEAEKVFASVETFGIGVKVIKTEQKVIIETNFDNIKLPDDIKFSGRLLIRTGTKKRVLMGFNETTSTVGNVNITNLKKELIFK
jgi:hypothetical protein